MKLRRRATLRWEKPPKKVLFVKKTRDRDVAAKSNEMIEWLMSKGLEVYVETDAAASAPANCKLWQPKDSDVDFGIVVGGTVLSFTLRTSWERRSTTDGIVNQSTTTMEGHCHRASRLAWVLWVL